MQETCSKVPLPLLERKKVRKKRSWPPQKLLTRETSYKVFGRRPPDAESLPQAQPAGVRKPAREDTMGPATRVWHHRCCRQSDGAPHETRRFEPIPRRL